MGWVYSDLTHTAKENGGPDAYIKTIHDAGKEEGWNEGYNDGKADGRLEVIIIGGIIAGGIGIIKLAKFAWNKLKPKKKENPEQHVSEEEIREAEEKLKEELRKQTVKRTEQEQDEAQKQDPDLDREKKEGGVNGVM